ncbi:MAG: hypothetical protein ABEL76_00100 [Bradymonadaceae bacterium]
MPRLTVSHSTYLGCEIQGKLDGTGAVGKRDAAVVRFEPDGTRSWTDVIGTSENEVARATVVTGADRPIVVGRTFGNLGGKMNQGSGDGYLWKPKTP